MRGMHSSVSSVAYPNINPCKCTKGKYTTAAVQIPMRLGILEENLVSSSDVILQAVDMDSLCDVRRLLLQGHQYVAGFVIEAWTRRKKHAHPASINEKNGWRDTKFADHLCLSCHSQCV